jgi:hypothetical protein
MIAFLAVLCAAATPVAGLEIRPLSRADLSWIGDERGSGVAVGEFDGVVRPGLQPYGGAWMGPHWGLFGSLGIARLTTTSWAGDTWRQVHWGVIRPEIDLRYGFMARELRRPVLWAFAGAYGDIPSARDASNGFTEEEQNAADQDALEERLRLGGVGGRIGAGVDYRVLPGLILGADFDVGGHFGVLRGSDSSTVSSWIATQGALVIAFEWGPVDAAEGER